MVYKLQSDIKASTDLKNMLEGHIFKENVQFT